MTASHTAESGRVLERTYIVHVRVTVTDDRPDDPEHEEEVAYAAYEQARAGLVENRADWWAEETF